MFKVLTVGTITVLTWWLLVDRLPTLYMVTYNDYLILEGLACDNSSGNQLQSKLCQGGLNRKEMQLNLCIIFFVLIFNELYLST